MIELCGGNQGLISSAHHGLYEVPLRKFYPHLDLDEAVAFAASSWERRRREPGNFSRLVQSASAYEIFSEIFKIGMPWVNKHLRISDAQRRRHQRLNPYRRKDLRARLERVDPEAVDTLRERLQEDICEYVFHCQYQSRKMARGGDNYKLEIMNFQNVYPRRGRIVPAFAAEVSRIISGYPREYEPIR